MRHPSSRPRRSPRPARGHRARRLLRSDEASGGAGRRGPIAVKATDTACEVSRTEAPAGTVEFTITNSGNKVNEFYVYAEGDRIMGEVENVAPGLTRTFHVDLSEPGTLPDRLQAGDGGRRHPRAVHRHRAPRPRPRATTRTSRPPSPSTSATSPRSPTRSSPRPPSSSRSSRPARSTRPRRSTRRPAPTGSGSSRWPSPSATSTRRSTAAPRSSTRAWSSPATTASRRTCGRTACSPTPRPSPTSCSPTSPSSSTKAKAVELNPLQLANGSKALLDEIATGKITGEEERYSHTDLWDFEANFEGSKAAIAAAAPLPPGPGPGTSSRAIDATRQGPRRPARDATATVTGSCSTPR